MNKKLIALVVMIGLLTLAFGARVLPKGAALATDDTNNHTISVSGVGSISIAPDIAYLNFGVFAENKDPQAAMDAMSKSANTIVNALIKAGIKKEDIKTTNLSLYPIYSWEKDTGKQVLEGYRASESFNVKTSIDNAGKILSLVNASGANEISGISFDASNKNELKLQAIEAAMKDARAKADAALKGTNYKVTGIKTIAVESSSPVFPIYKGMDVAAENVPIEGGTISVDASVSVIFTFD